MFSGIVEATGKIVKFEKNDQVVRVWILRPHDFQDLKMGDSISCNGVCLTVEHFDENCMQFALAYETLKVLNLMPETLTGQVWNLERSLRFGDRVHGHLVTGHVEAQGTVLRSESAGDIWFLNVLVPQALCRFIWPKGSICLHGVSLTVNRFEASVLEVCLIPETLKRTNLSQFHVGDKINLETDYLAKAYLAQSAGRDHGLS